MHKLRIKKKITPPAKQLAPIFSDAVETKPKKQSPPSSTKVEAKVPTPPIEKNPRNTVVKGTKKVLPSLSISINKPANKVSEPAQELNGGVEKKKLNKIIPLETDTLLKAWKALLDFIPEDQITLRQSVKSSQPKIIAEHEFKITVSNKIQAEIVQERMAMVMEFLQEKLQNHALKMQVEVSAREESNLVFTSNDKFKLMVEKNPAVEELRKRLDLELD